MAKILAGRYCIKASLGAGASGEVYLAWDPLLQVDVALKRLRAEWADDPVERGRLLREARVLSNLDHPHINRVKDVLTGSDGNLTLVMELVSGPTLETRLKAGPLPPREAVRIARELASALVAAHAAGVIHRDLKPANIRFTEANLTKVLDFGLARMTRPGSDGTPYAVSVTGSRSGIGQFVGTPAYMANEIYAGASADARSDIYSLGVVLFEMLTGQRPFGANRMPELAEEITRGPIPRADAVRPGVPSWLADTVGMAMARDPAARFATAQAAEAALKLAEQKLAKRGLPRAIALIGVAGVLAAGWASWNSTSNDNRRAVSEPSVVAVLPFAGQSGELMEAIFAAGLTDRITTRLRGLPVSVVAADPASKDARERDPSRVMNRTGATLLVDGALTCQAESCLVRMRIYRKRHAAAVWNDSLVGSTSAIGDLHQRLAHTLEAALLMQTSRTSGRQMRPRTAEPVRSPAALEAYSRARYLLDRYNTGNNLTLSIDQFRKAVQEDSSFGAAWAGLGQAYIWKYDVTGDTTYAEPARRALLAAERYEPDDPAVQLTRAELARKLGQHEAVHAITTPLTVAWPHSDAPWAALGASYAAQKRNAEAVDAYKEAIVRRPEFWEHHNELGRVYQGAGQLDEAMQEFRRVMELAPDNYIGSANLAATFFMKGDTTSAVRYAHESVAIEPQVGSLATLGYVAFSRGAFAEAAKYYQKCADLRPLRPANWRNLADAQYAAQDTSAARASYEQAISLCSAALSKEPTNVDRLRLRGYCLAKVRRFEAARSDLERAVKSAPESKDAYFAYAVTEALAGNQTAALQALEKALHYGYSRAEARLDLDLRSLSSAPEFNQLMVEKSPDTGK